MTMGRRWMKMRVMVPLYRKANSMTVVEVFFLDPGGCEVSGRHGQGAGKRQVQGG